MLDHGVAEKLLSKGDLLAGLGRGIARASALVERTLLSAAVRMHFCIAAVPRAIVAMMQLSARANWRKSSRAERSRGRRGFLRLNHED